MAYERFFVRNIDGKNERVFLWYSEAEKYFIHLSKTTLRDTEFIAKKLNGSFVTICSFNFNNIVIDKERKKGYN